MTLKDLSIINDGNKPQESGKDVDVEMSDASWSQVSTTQQAEMSMQTVTVN